mmetsp:Transcript_6500/g.5694  ORF Transcript_6500/g.5694 Transcript_6500/m.5694 type:complete len:224 (+) Transcript_6500:436-1107(+)
MAYSTTPSARRFWGPRLPTMFMMPQRISVRSSCIWRMGQRRRYSPWSAAICMATGFNMLLSPLLNFGISASSDVIFPLSLAFTFLACSSASRAASRASLACCASSCARACLIATTSSLSATSASADRNPMAWSRSEFDATPHFLMSPSEFAHIMPTPRDPTDLSTSRRVGHDDPASTNVLSALVCTLTHPPLNGNAIEEPAKAATTSSEPTAIATAAVHHRRC